MTPAGEAAIVVGKKNGKWTVLDGVEDLLVPPDLAKKLRSYPKAKENFDGFPPSARRGILEWIQQAKRPETRAKRLGETARHAIPKQNSQSVEGQGCPIKAEIVGNSTVEHENSPGPSMGPCPITMPLPFFHKDFVEYG